MIGITCHNIGHPPNSKPPGPQPPMEKAHRVKRNVVGRGDHLWLGNSIAVAKRTTALTAHLGNTNTPGYPGLRIAPSAVEMLDLPIFIAYGGSFHSL